MDVGAATPIGVRLGLPRVHTVSNHQGDLVMAITAEQATFLLHNVYLPALRNETRTTKKILEAVPADKAGYQPDSCAKTADELLRHIAVAENFFLEAPLNGAFNPGGVKIPDGAKTPGEVAAWYEQTVNKNLEALAKLSGEQLIK